MTLPSNHSCEGSNCDPEDEEHRALETKRQNQLRIRAAAKADQAWANVRGYIPELTKVRDKVKNQEPLTERDAEFIDMALCIILGELYLRKAQTY